MNNLLFNLSIFLFLLGVPLQNHPHGETWAFGGEPLPSPPPWGWSHGFFITPRTVGLIPSLRWKPAFFILENLWDGFETIPSVHKRLLDNFNCHPEDNFKTDPSIVFEIDFADEPADLTNLNPENGKISIEEIWSNKFVLNNDCVDPFLEKLDLLSGKCPPSPDGIKIPFKTPSDDNIMMKSLNHDKHIQETLYN